MKRNRRGFLRTGGAAALGLAARVPSRFAEDTTKSPGAAARRPQEQGVLSQGGANNLTICFNASSSVETAAAQELHKYISQITGKKPRLIDAASPTNTAPDEWLFLVGRTPATAQLIDAGALSDPVRTNPEAYVVRSLPKSGNNKLVFLGGTGRATLYAVYHYLEGCCGVEFFQDGDHVPRRTLAPVTDLDLTARPYFSERMTNLTNQTHQTKIQEHRGGDHKDGVVLHLPKGGAGAKPTRSERVRAPGGLELGARLEAKWKMRQGLGRAFGGMGKPAGAQSDIMSVRDRRPLKVLP